MARLVLHVGTHKTATTHIQDMFFHNRALLARHGVIYPEIGRTRGHHGLAGQWIPMPERFRVDDPAEQWPRLADRVAGSDATLFLSSEEFSRLKPRQVPPGALKDLTRRFDEVLLVCVLRHQAGYLQSIYQQISSDRAPPPWPAYFAAAIRSGFADGLPLDFLRLWRHFRQGFAPSQIRFLSYEASVAGPGGIVGAMLRLLGLTLDPSALEPFAAQGSNLSPNPLATFAANIAAHPAHAGRGMVGLMERCVAEDVPNPRALRPTLYSRAELARLCAQFEPSNRALAARLAQHDLAFRMAPPPDPETLLFRGALRERFWIGASRALRAARESGLPDRSGAG